MPRYQITNFSRGEFAPQLYGRVDVPQYAAGAREITNFIVQRYGGVSFRPGFRFVGEVVDPSIPMRYVPFVFSNEQAYVMSLGDRKLELLAEGGFITEDDLQIIDVVYGLQTILHVPYHAMVAGDRIYVDGTNIPALNGRFATVTAVPDADHITVNINSVDGACFGTFTTSTGITRIGAPSPPPAPPADLPTPPAPADPPTTTGGGSVGSGGGTGTYRGSRDNEEQF